MQCKWDSFRGCFHSKQDGGMIAWKCMGVTGVEFWDIWVNPAVQCHGKVKMQWKIEKSVILQSYNHTSDILRDIHNMHV